MKEEQIQQDEDKILPSSQLITTYMSIKQFNHLCFCVHLLSWFSWVLCSRWIREHSLPGQELDCVAVCAVSITVLSEGNVMKVLLPAACGDSPAPFLSICGFQFSHFGKSDALAVD